MLKYIMITVLLISGNSCQAQERENLPNKIVGGPCEGCEAIYEYGSQKLTSTDTLPGFDRYDPKIKITGTVFQKDKTTPAEGVILYIYHTNRQGIYDPGEGAKGWQKRHGKYRGWVQTDADGRYTFYTFRPAAYPDSRQAEHIHLTVKEPGKNEYYMDEYVFSDDPYLTLDKRKGLPDRGGSGIVTPKRSGDVLLLERNLFLGYNIPDYD